MKRLVRLGVDEEADKERMDGVKNERVKRKVMTAWERSKLVTKYMEEVQEKDGEEEVLKDVAKENDESCPGGDPPQHSDLMQLLNLFDKQQISEGSSHNHPPPKTSPKT